MPGNDRSRLQGRKVKDFLNQRENRRRPMDNHGGIGTLERLLDYKTHQ
jgi:hypothetical protein